MRRYQVNGVWGLAPEYDPERFHRAWHKGSPIDFAAATPKSQAEARRRYDLIAPFIGRRRIPKTELEKYAKKHGTSWRTLRDYLFKYKKWGLAGLLPKEERSDKGHPHNMSPLMEDIITAIRFSQIDIPLHEVHRRACQRARYPRSDENLNYEISTLIRALLALAMHLSAMSVADDDPSPLSHELFIDDPAILDAGGFPDEQEEL